MAKTTVMITATKGTTDTVVITMPPQPQIAARLVTERAFFMDLKRDLSVRLTCGVS